MNEEEKRLVPYTDPADVHYFDSGIYGYEAPIVNTVLRLRPESEGEAMTTQELAQKILDIVQKALAEELKDAIFIGYDPGICKARSGLEDIAKLCQEQLEKGKEESA